MAIGPRVVISTLSAAGTRYASPTGTGTACTFGSPCSERTAIEGAVAGDVVFLLGGVYRITSNLTINQSGILGIPIIIESYPGDLAIFNGDANPWGTGIQLSITGDYIHFRKIEITASPITAGLHITGDNNIIQGINSHHNPVSGIQITGNGANNRIIDCLCNDNSGVGVTPANGGDSDGISISTGANNRIEYCETLRNSDDGVDVWKSTDSVVTHSISGLNGLGDGDGNGIKAGGESPSKNALVEHCLSYSNVENGFDSNTGVGVTFRYNTAWNNGANGFDADESTITSYNISDSDAAPDNRQGTLLHNSWQRGGPVSFKSTTPGDVDFLEPTDGTNFVDLGAYSDEVIPVPALVPFGERQETPSLNVSSPHYTNLVFVQPMFNWDMGLSDGILAGSRLILGNGSEAPISTPTALSGVKNSLIFDGVNDVARVESLDLSSYGVPFSISCWFYWDVYADNDEPLLEFGSSFFLNPGSILIAPNWSSDSTFACYFRLGINNRWVRFTRPSAATWHHLAVSLLDEGSGPLVRAWIDGVLQTPISGGGPSIITGNFANSRLNILNRGTTPENLEAAGQITDLRMENIGFTQADVDSRYDLPTRWDLYAVYEYAEKPEFGNENINGSIGEKLTAGYLFNRGSGDFAVDIIGGGGDATVRTVPLSPARWVTLDPLDNTALDFTGVAGEELLLALNPITTLGSGYTVVSKIIPSTITVPAALFSINDSSSTAIQDAIFLNVLGVDGQIAVGSRNLIDTAGSFEWAIATSVLVAGMEVTIGATFVSPNERSIWVNGVKEATNTGFIGNDPVDITVIGALGDSTPGAYFNGRIAYCYIFPTVLSAEEMLAIHNDAYRIISKPTDIGRFFLVFD